MSDLQLRRIESAIDDSKALESRLDSMARQIELILNDILDHQRTLHAVRLGMIREQGEAKAAERDSVLAEIAQLHEMLASLPEGAVIDRMSLQARLAEVSALLDGRPVEYISAFRYFAPPPPPTPPPMLTDEQIEAIAKPFIRPVGSHWENEDAIPEGRVEEFARAIEQAVMEQGGCYADAD